MHWVRDIAGAILVVSLAGGVIVLNRASDDKEAVITRLTTDTTRLEREVKYRAATNAVEINARGWPVSVSPDWFDGKPPRNELLDAGHPWCEIAPPSEAALQHPPVRIAIAPTIAGFWYNPYQGVVRARVPMMVNDEQSLDLYNRINRSSLPSIFWNEPIPKSIAPGASVNDDAVADTTADDGIPGAPMVEVKRTKPGVGRR